MSKKKILLTAAIVAAVAAIGVSVAFMFRQAAVKNVFSAGVVDCKVHENLDGGTFSEGTHYGLEKHSIKVENTGNVKAYIRVRVVSYWVDADDNVVGIPSKMPDIQLKSGWFEGESNTYYYESAVDPSDFTSVMCSPIALETATDADNNTVYQSVDIQAEAIQSSPAEKVAAVWGVSVSGEKLKKG